MKTLKEVIPQVLGCEYHDSQVRKYVDVQVVSEHNSSVNKWPGIHKNVHFWVLLENGRAVGWNESPTHGWSFPVIRNMATIKMEEELKCNIS
jgi:hypothetical protein